ncbi:MAG: response regulator transcription factor [Limnochordales bacterium]|nr:response regulator transcription factor [Limnochordales bacterium]
MWRFGSPQLFTTDTGGQGSAGKRFEPSRQQAGKAEAEEILAHLTPREREVLALMAKGYNNREIASTLFISMHTVKNHISSIYRKLGTGDRTRVVLMAVRAGLVSLN